MANLSDYPKIVERVLDRHSDVKYSSGDIDVQRIYDRERHHYQLMRVGWVGNERVHSTRMHIDIHDGKVWVQSNTTEINIADELMEAGIPREHIVLGFQAPFMRQFTDFAVA